MESAITTRQLNNKGFSLIEILVALAVSGIVVVMIATLMTNGSFLFQSENNKINLQNELQMVDSFMTETVLEAKALSIVNHLDSVSTVKIYTGNRDASTNALLPVAPPSYSTDPDATTATPVITTERILTYVTTGDKQGLYITKSLVSVDNLTKGHMISNCVTNLTVEIDDSCKKTDEDGNEYYANPIILKVSVTVTDGDKSKTEQFTYRVRNQLGELYYNGTTYTVK